MIATGNHYYLDSLRGAPPPEGAARGLCGFALDFLNGILRTANPSATLTRGPPPLSGEVGYAHQKRP